MANHDSGDDGSIADIPWAAAFDPALNVRALGEIQARGFRAATDLVDRFVQKVPAMTRDTQEPVSRLEPQQDRSGADPALPNVDQVFGVWQRLVGQAMQSLRGATSPDAGIATIDFVKGRASSHISLEVSHPGAVSAEVWLHNGGPEDLGKIRLRCSDLLAHDGEVIGFDLVLFDPAAVPMVARSSRGVMMQIDVADDVRPGRYRGTLLADGHPDVWLSVELNVLPPAP